MKEVTCKDLSCWNMSISMLFGKTPKVGILCGNCGKYFSHRFDTNECIRKTPRVFCPYCDTINKIPIKID